MICDGWGHSENSEHNAIAAAHTPQWDAWWQTRPHILLNASGVSVGLPEGQMGNSEVGHMHLGAGRIIAQDFTRINSAISDGSYANNPVFVDMIHDLKARHKRLHVLGLLSQGGVHSHEEHLFSFLRLCAHHHFSDVCLHVFLDGRDTPPQSAHSSLMRLQDCLKQYPVATICSIAGRYYSMDRDQRWERIESVYQVLTTPSNTVRFKSAIEAVDHYYEQGIYDEFIPATPVGMGYTIEDGDSLFFFNFRADRARQLTQSFIDETFQGFHRHTKPNINRFVSMTSYAQHLATISAYPNHILHNTLGEILAKQGLTQLRLAETEKYAHVTFFLNGGSERAFDHETRLLIESPKIATYDLQPEMSARQVTQALIKAIKQDAYDVIICNYANADMVGHTGQFSATVRAIECLDQAMHDIWTALSPLKGQLIITADHGNAEAMFDDETAQAHTAHTQNPVPFLYVGNTHWHANTETGRLIDVAPTLLSLLGITPPIEMTGNTLLTHTASSLLQQHNKQYARDGDPKQRQSNR